jgi:hypothetical protein
MLDAYMKWNHSIKEEDLLRVLRDAASHGYISWVVINGEYYSVELDKSKIPVPDDNDF